MVIPEKLEPFLRWEYLDLDEDEIGGEDDVNIVTIGMNYYFNKHNAKFTLDVVWALDALPASSTGLGLLADDRDGDDQVAVRAQFQLLF